MSPWEGGPKKQTREVYSTASGLSDLEVHNVPEEESVSARDRPHEPAQENPASGNFFFVF